MPSTVSPRTRITPAIEAGRREAEESGELAIEDRRVVDHDVDRARRLEAEQLVQADRRRASSSASTSCSKRREPRRPLDSSIATS